MVIGRMSVVKIVINVNNYTENSAEVERRYCSLPSHCVHSLRRLFIWDFSSTTWSRVDSPERRGCHFQLPPRRSRQVHCDRLHIV